VTATVLSPAPKITLPGPDLPRLLAGPSDLAAHLASYGPLPSQASHVWQCLEGSGLRGRGGAAFPTARKIAAVAAAKRGAVVVANGAEGEPLSAKDKVLLTHAPHLVLDGMALAAQLVGASRQILCFEVGNREVEAAVRCALGERNDDGVELFATPRRYLSGQENALVGLLNGGPGKPTLTRPFERGVDGLPTLVDNVETLAHLALIARFGSRWYREIGTPEDPGSTLVTIGGAVNHPGVYEIAHGWRLEDVLAHAGARNPRAVLLGGYYGRWAGVAETSRLRLDSVSLGHAGYSLGCGVIAVVDDSTCAVAETARVAAWFAANSAGQCGACTWGLADLALTTSNLTSPRPEPAGLTQLVRWSAMIEGRGACKLPDGAVAFLRSALDVFAGEIHEHLVGACCRPKVNLLPTPAPEPWA
jgi:NADH:ubiquinone oxidoreductase subunit F (NADH-binding)